MSKIKVAFISGINYPQFVTQGDIAFTLCDWISNNKEYKQFYKKNKQYKITDNMAAENGISSNIYTILTAARDINADEVWASDKLYDKKETLKLTNQFIKSLNPTDKFKIVGIPQGNNHKEWMECYNEMINNPKIDIIALSKYSCPKVFAKLAKTKVIGKARPYAIKWLYERNLLKKPIHLAGGDNFIINEIREMKKYPMVRSIDSNICFKLGVMGIKIDKCKKEPKKRLNHYIKNLTKNQLDLIQYNINKVKEEI